MSKKFIRHFSVLLSLFLLLSCMPTISLASEKIEQFIPATPFDLPDLPVSDVPSNNKGESNIPVSFDARDYFTMPSIKNQSKYGACWAHAATAAIEVSLIRQGYPTDINLSELNLTEATYAPARDTLGNLGADKNTPVGDTPLNLGGNHLLAAFALSRWSGISDEKLMNYLEDSNYENAGGLFPDEYYYAYDEAHLTAYKLVSMSDTAAVKNMLMEYGIGSCAFYSSDANGYNSQTGAYYTTKTGTNHEVSIIGWDDNYSRENFNSKNRPSSDGAWLIRNSWGENFGVNGYCWISYQDASLDEEIAFFDACPADKYDYNYQYDGGFSYSSSSSSGGVANIYTSQQNEYIKAVNVSVLTTANASVQIAVYRNPSSDFVRKDTPVIAQTEYTTCSGIYTFDLETPVYVEEGDTFAVYYRIVNGSSTSYYSFSMDANWGWLDIKEDLTDAVCYRFSSSGIATKVTDKVYRIKAYTVAADIGTPDNFTANYENTNAMLSWDAVDGADSYEVFTALNNGAWTLAETTASAGTTLPVDPVKGITFNYKVRAVKDGEKGDFSLARTIRLSNNTGISMVSLADQKMCVGSEKTLKATFLPSSASDTWICCTVADESVAKVDGNVITALSAGETTLTLLTRTNIKTKTVQLTVTEHSPAEAVIENEIPVVCTTPGSYDEVVYCSICSEEISRTTVEIPGGEHTPGTAVKENEILADCVSSGSCDMVVYCTVCCEELARTTTVTQPLPHTEVVTIEAKDPDCTHPGNTNEVRCSVCSSILTESAVIEPKGHTPGASVIENYIDATCAKAGSYDEVVYCTVCSSEVSRTRKTIPVTGHNYVDGYCTVCGEEKTEQTPTCSHMCHQSGFMGIIWKIINFFNKLFGTNPVCTCGAAHR